MVCVWNYLLDLSYPTSSVGETNCLYCKTWICSTIKCKCKNEKVIQVLFLSGKQHYCIKLCLDSNGLNSALITIIWSFPHSRNTSCVIITDKSRIGPCHSSLVSRIALWIVSTRIILRAFWWLMRLGYMIVPTRLFVIIVWSIFVSIQRPTKK